MNFIWFIVLIDFVVCRVIFLEIVLNWNGSFIVYDVEMGVKDGIGIRIYWG